jgi:hypothetical protein
MNEKSRRPDDKPADRLINRYMPNATPEERDSARYWLEQHARLTVRVEDRLAKEWWETKGKHLHGPPEPEGSNTTVAGV